MEMQLISYVYSEMGREWITGLTPPKKVVANTIREIKELINQREANVSFEQFEFEAQVSKLRLQKGLNLPLEVASPRNRSIKPLHLLETLRWRRGFWKIQVGNVRAVPNAHHSRSQMATIT